MEVWLSGRKRRSRKAVAPKGARRFESSHFRMIILAVETSCDETAISIVEASGDIKNPQFKLLGSAIQSQIKIHEPFGGVVPNLAKREHAKNLPLVLLETLKNSGFDSKKIEDHKLADIFRTISEGRFDRKLYEDFWIESLESISAPKIDMIAVTVGPGLEPALWTGIEFAKLLSKKWAIPILATNHMEGHIASVLLNKPEEFPTTDFQFSNKKEGKMAFPAIALLISGGHTELVLLNNWGDKKKIGETLDDAVGEAFDKVARMLGLPYPGGPEISRLAEEARKQNIKNDVKFPRPMVRSRDLNFSFSGLKTSVLYYLRGKSLSQEADFSEQEKMAVAREFEDAVIETLITKTKTAIDKYNPKSLIIGGGVIANKALRESFLGLYKDYPHIKIMIPERSLTTDNATMIAIAGYVEYLLHSKTESKPKAQGNLDIN